MNEHYVTSLEWSERLKACGVWKMSEFYWVTFDNSACVDTPSTYKTLRFTELCSAEEASELEEKDYIQIISMIPAYLTDELEGMLPKRAEIELSKSYVVGTDEVRWRAVLTWKDGKDVKMPMGFSDTLPNALAAMVEYCKQNKII